MYLTNKVVRCHVAFYIITVAITLTSLLDGELKNANIMSLYFTISKIFDIIVLGASYRNQILADVPRQILSRRRCLHIDVELLFVARV